jgi:hypothetical protein
MRTSQRNESELARYTSKATAPKTYMAVHGGLNCLKGNALPYFSLTCAHIEHGRDVGGGADHEAILARFPQFADLAALHLSGIDGVPMHAVANAKCWAKEGDVVTLAQHLRCPEQVARELTWLIGRGEISEFEAQINAMRPRWKAEAQACIAKHGLVVFGDPWTDEG